MFSLPPISNTFYHLTYLELSTYKPKWWNLLTLMLDTSPNLQILKIIDFMTSQEQRPWEKWNEPKNVPECLLLHLETFLWTCYEGKLEDEIELAKYILRNARLLKKATFSIIESNSDKRVEMVDELKSVVRASNSSFASLATKMKRCLRNGNGVNEDRISDLPEALLLQILSMLPVKDVVTTSVLSKPWRSLWKLVPILKFDYDNNQSEDETYSEIVCRLLLSNKAPVLESLHLDFEVGKCRPVDVGMWIGIAYARHVRDLVLHVISKKGSFKFPTSLYNCETLESLTLATWVLVDVPSQVCLKSLRTLRLEYVDYEDSETFLNLLSGCPKLENLVLYHELSDMETFTIAVPSLQRLTIFDANDAQSYGGYVINAPSLKYLKIDGFNTPKSCLIENAPELVEATIMNVSKIINEKLLESLTSVKRLSLALSPLEIKFPTGSIFYQLVSLELYTNKAEWWNLLVLMLDSSPKLQVLKLNGKWSGKNNHLAIRDWDQPKNVPGCLLFHLETFMWKGCKRIGEDEKEVAIYILRNTNRLKRATFSRIIYEENNSQDMVENRKMVEELESVVRASKSCKLVFESTLWSLS
ncbi:Leucine-rich repeat 2 [Arabidopsis suecica]|nr:Leucine-rich repeat 2 [Arabidopsis suecica]KAG7632712.1 Leucine-rich repeat 2 [Arabidopsis suecica]